ncbi:MAG: 2-C-methyl-D-erythritol 2,4-cyclodiphosphate synthase [candidate division Zixibacteria bacterium]|nr:2-C-methyl-D-erythritol 2,4-cyclodiphosphate synthase [candidate division Zixibacteria bacterium]
MSEYRVGYGYDVHRLIEGRKLILGGVEIEFEKGLDGHSDADVVLHAICEAMLGAAALGDIGEHFPPDNPKYKDADSRELLKQVHKKVKESGWSHIENIDVTIMAERPKLTRFKALMKEEIAKLLGIDSSRVNIKATTAEGLGAVGRQEGIAAAAVCLLKNDD